MIVCVGFKEPEVRVTHKPETDSIVVTVREDTEELALALTMGAAQKLEIMIGQMLADIAGTALF